MKIAQVYTSEKEKENTRNIHKHSINKTVTFTGTELRQVKLSGYLSANSH